MHKFSAIVLCFILFGVSAVSVCFAQDVENDIRIFVDGIEISDTKKPVIENSRTLAPVRSVAEAADIKVGWDAEKYSVSLSHDAITATLTIGSDRMTVYNSVIDELSEVKLDAVPKIIDSSTYITLRAALEQVGARVEWDGEERIIYVTSPDKVRSEPKKEETDSAPTDTEQSADEKTQGSDNGNEGKTKIKAAGSKHVEVEGMEYTGFREMENHEITAHALHGLYGRIISEKPITMVHCRIAGTEMDAFLKFKAEDNLKNYNVFTYFDRLMCFSDAGYGKQLFEVYAAVDNGDPMLVFSYEYIVLGGPQELYYTDEETSKEAVQEPSKEDTDITEDKTEDNIPEEKEETTKADADTPEKEETVSTEIKAEAKTDSDKEDDSITEIPEVSETEPIISYRGFRKMSDDEVVAGAPHGLYGTLVSNVPMTGVRCRIVGTDMDYSIELIPEDEINTYNVFEYFDKLICFSDAHLGENIFEIYASAAGCDEHLIFAYKYNVISAEQAAQKKEQELSENKIENVVRGEVCLPLEGEISLTSPYGYRAYNKWEFHKGIDIISSKSLNIISVADGTVVDCATGRNSGVGNYVAIQHEEGWVSLYYHLASYNVEIGDKVKMGDVIAVMGNSGGNYGVHLHFMTCDGWYGNLWATQNSHHKPIHEYVPHVLEYVSCYNPSYEKQSTDRIILCNFNFPNTLEQGSAYSISGTGAYVAAENNCKSLRVTVTDENGNVLIDETDEETVYYSYDGYNFTNISAKLDKMCEFDKLPEGKMTVSFTAVTSEGRERVIYTKNFEVIPKTEKEEEETEEQGESDKDAESDTTDVEEGKETENNSDSSENDVSDATGEDTASDTDEESKESEAEAISVTDGTQEESTGANEKQTDPQQEA